MKTIGNLALLGLPIVVKGSPKMAVQPQLTFVKDAGTNDKEADG